MPQTLVREPAHVADQGPRNDGQQLSSVPQGTAVLLSLATALLLTSAIWLLDDRLTAFRLTPIQRNFWYAWQLAAPTQAARVSAWTLYALHQGILWGLIYYAQKHVGRYSDHLHTVNVFALGTNLVFALAHIAQTQLFYDGLAQDVHEASSLASVVVMLVIVLIMENRERGLFFGKRAPISERVVSFLRRYHGYYFSWAITYTFWYHPTVSTPGHLAGFAYMFLLLIQGSLFFTRLHTHRLWRFTVEFGVFFHSVAVAWMVPQFSVARFLFGWLLLFVITQMHGLGLSSRVRWLLSGLYVVGVLGWYAHIGLKNVHEVLRVPVAEYVVAAIVACLIALALKLTDVFSERRTAPSSQPSTP